MMETGFSGVRMQLERLDDGEHEAVIHRGIAMECPSDIAVQLVMDLVMESGNLRPVPTGGAAVVVSEGALLV